MAFKLVGVSKLDCNSKVSDTELFPSSNEVDSRKSFSTGELLREWDE